MIKLGFNWLFGSKFLEYDQIVTTKSIRSEFNRKVQKRSKEIKKDKIHQLFSIKFDFFDHLINFKVVFFDHLIENFWSFNRKCIKDWKLIKINQKLASSFKWNPIFVVGIKSDWNQRLNLNSLESELSTIGFVSPNHLSLKYTI